MGSSECSGMHHGVAKRGRANTDGHDSEASSAEHSEDDVLAAYHAPARRSIGEADRPHGSSYKP